MIKKDRLHILQEQKVSKTEKGTRILQITTVLNTFGVVEFVLKYTFFKYLCKRYKYFYELNIRHIYYTEWKKQYLI